MTFEHWWASITESERKLLQEGYARYIWNTAQAAVRQQDAMKPKLTAPAFDPRQTDLFNQ